MERDAAPLMPVQAALLAQLFPVLADVQALSRARSANVAADPAARRLQAFTALSALLGNLAEERPLILVVDDLQWSAGTALLEKAHDISQAHFADKPWSLALVRYQLGVAWYWMGEHAHLARKMDAWIHEAQERKDPLTVALLSGMGNGCVRFLMRDDPAAALSELSESMLHPARSAAGATRNARSRCTCPAWA